MSAQTKRPSWLANLPGRYKILLAILPLLLLFMLTSIATLTTLGLESAAREQAQRTYTLLLAIDDAREVSQISVINARGYMLSGDAQELAVYEAGRRNFATQMTRLRSLAGNAMQRLQLDEVQALADRWQREIDTGVVAPLRHETSPDTIAATIERGRISDAYRATRTLRGADVAVALSRMADTEQAVLAQHSLRADSALKLLGVLTALAALFGLAFGGYVMWLSNRLIVRPLRQITDMMNRVAARDTSVTITRLRRNDEIGELARALHVFKQMVLDINDQAWVKSQLTLISQRLQSATTHREFAQLLTAEVAPLLHAGVALYYLHDPRRDRLDLLGSYGLQESWGATDALAPGEGLVGQCLVQRQPIELDHLPAHYVHVQSGSGEAAPTHLFILPVMHRDVVTGVLELGGFAAPGNAQRELLGELLPLVALTQENLTRAVNTQDLLERTRLQAEDLRVSELLMRQQKAVLHESNDALQIKTDELLASQLQLREQAEQLGASNAQLREQTEHLDRQHAVLEELQQETAEKADQLARASQYKSEFLANMSHELRTPLNSLLILSRNLGDNASGNLDASQVESARIIHDAGSSLLGLINDILDLSKIEAGRMEPVIDALPLVEFAQRLERSFAHVARERKLGFSVTLAPNLPSTLRTDGARLQQVTNNLLSNAFKFTAQGRVSVELTLADGAGEDVPAPLRGQPLLAISVSDTGMGIPADKFRRIFNAFEQVDASTSRQFGGTGLGLAISRRLAHLLGGELDVHSEVGAGSRFVVWLPLTPPDVLALPETGNESRPMTATVAWSPTRAEGRASLLIIEDDTVFAGILASLVEQQGHRALVAHDGDNGLRLAREQHPDGILLDVALPTIDGWSVLASLQSQPDTRDIPVHFISASDEAKRATAEGAVGFLVKPVTRESIATALGRVLHTTGVAPHRVLVVDDDAAARHAIRVELQRDDVQLDDAASAEDALVRIAHTNYDCIVLDLGLPGMSGLEMLEQLAAATGGTPPVVVYSGRDLSTAELAQLHQHTRSIVPKAARVPEQLREEVRRFLHRVAPANDVAQEQPTKPVTLTGHHLLLVDDDMRNLFALAKVLRDWGLHVLMAQNGQRALDILAEHAEVQAVLMDIMMPVMDGYAAIAAIRAQPTLATLPVIALTAKAMAGDRERCIEAGASDYLSKPVDLDQLAAMLEHWLRGRDAQEAPQA